MAPWLGAPRAISWPTILAIRAIALRGVIVSSTYDSHATCEAIV
jgi:hypothetical protein